MIFFKGRRGGEIEPMNSRSSEFTTSSRSAMRRTYGRELYVDESPLLHSVSASEVRRSSLIKEVSEYRKETSRLAVDDSLTGNFPFFLFFQTI